MADCQSCRDAGRKQPAHYIEDGGGICRWCRSGEQHPAEKAKQRDLEKLAAGTVALEVQMAAPKSGRPCGCGCSRFLRKDNKTGFISGHKTGQQPKMRAQGGRTDGRTDGKLTIQATPELCDAIWAALPLPKKAAMVNKLSEL